MQTMDGALMQLYKSLKITGDEAYQKSISKPKFESLKGTGAYGR